MTVTRLTPTSYVVLGLIEAMQPATPYDLKRVAGLGVAHFWSLPHTQLYGECARLAEAGLLSEKRERGGRRRRVYRITAAGRRELDAWRADPETDHYELRDPGLLKLFFGADPAELAAAQLEIHRRRLQEFEALAELEGIPEPQRLALESGIGHEREYVRFWSRLGDR